MLHNLLVSTRKLNENFRMVAVFLIYIPQKGNINEICVYWQTYPCTQVQDSTSRGGSFTVTSQVLMSTMLLLLIRLALNRETCHGLMIPHISSVRFEIALTESHVLPFVCFICEESSARHTGIPKAARFRFYSSTSETEMNNSVTLLHPRWGLLLYTQSGPEIIKQRFHCRFPWRSVA
jgi:hypothetical protein